MHAQERQSPVGVNWVERLLRVAVDARSDGVGLLVGSPFAIKPGLSKARKLATAMILFSRPPRRPGPRTSGSAPVFLARKSQALEHLL